MKPLTRSTFLYPLARLAGGYVARGTAAGLALRNGSATLINVYQNNARRLTNEGATCYGPSRTPGALTVRFLMSLLHLVAHHLAGMEDQQPCASLPPTAPEAATATA